MNYYRHTIKTEKKQEMIDISNIVQDYVEKSEIMDGIVFVFCHHTTAGITINENADINVQKDIIETLNEIIPINNFYKHKEGNSHAHIKSSLIGVDKSVIINKGKLVLGTWQSIFLCEFDGPGERTFSIKII